MAGLNVRFHLEWCDEVEELGTRGEYLRGILSEPDRIFLSAWRYEGCMGVI